jgi:hypothetical protein
LYRQIFRQGWIAIEDFIVLKSCAPHLPKRLQRAAVRPSLNSPSRADAALSPMALHARFFQTRFHRNELDLATFDQPITLA